MDKRELATFAGGCFWCMVTPFLLPGVENVIAGYTGGYTKNPSYEDVCSHKTGHVEAVEITYDPAKITYEQILSIYWRQIDPTDGGGQFADRGEPYHTAIFYHNEEQKQKAEASKKALLQSVKFDKPIATEIRPAETFYPAEEYHQNYFMKNPEHYHLYRRGSARDVFRGEHWENKSNPDDLKSKLTKIQFEVTQKSATEQPFNNEYWDNNREGIYVDIVSGEPLFSSRDKYDSGCGWPSFTMPLEQEKIIEKPDHSLGVTRTEVRSSGSDSHLGHVFTDGPPPQGRRYCINSAALRFIPREELEKEGYGSYMALFD